MLYLLSHLSHHRYPVTDTLRIRVTVGIVRVLVPTSPSTTAITVPSSGTLIMCVLYIYTTMTINPYVSNIIQQTGMTEREVHQSTSAITREFPCTIHGRYFATEADYLDELNEFLNGM